MLYQDYISNEKQKSILKELNFLSKNFFFKTIPISVFKKKYFYDFVPLYLEKGKVIYDEKDKADCVYFVKEGEIELRIVSNLLELSKKIENLVLKTNSVKNVKKYINERSN